MTEINTNHKENQSDIEKVLKDPKIGDKIVVSFEQWSKIIAVETLKTLNRSRESLQIEILQEMFRNFASRYKGNDQVEITYIMSPSSTIPHWSDKPVNPSIL